MPGWEKQINIQESWRLVTEKSSHKQPIWIIGIYLDGIPLLFFNMQMPSIKVRFAFTDQDPLRSCTANLRTINRSLHTIKSIIPSLFQFQRFANINKCALEVLVNNFLGEVVDVLLNFLQSHFNKAL